MAYDLYAHADDGSVWYFGEDVADIEDGTIVTRDGTWLAGKDDSTEFKQFARGYGEYFTGHHGDVEALALAVPTDNSWARPARAGAVSPAEPPGSNVRQR